MYSGKSGGIIVNTNKEMVTHESGMIIGNLPNQKEIPTHDGINDEEIEFTLNEDRKRRRETKSTKDQRKNMDWDRDLGTISANTEDDITLEDQGEMNKTNQDNEFHSFLTAEPGFQACREP